MSLPLKLYPGNWPLRASKLSMYAVRFVDEEWQVAVYKQDESKLWSSLATRNYPEIVNRVNEIKKRTGSGSGGVFYINEFGHIIVPARIGKVNHCFYAGKAAEKIEIEFGDESYSGEPVNKEGRKLSAGDTWVGPLAGIPYYIIRNREIYFERPNFNCSDHILHYSGSTIRLNLSSMNENTALARQLIERISDFEGTGSGRFFVNEWQSIFAPRLGLNTNEQVYIYCGQLDTNGWFPEPMVSEKESA